jgi:hypothetical protein
MDADQLRTLQRRGRVFWEMFPGARASDEWTRDRDRRSKEMGQWPDAPNPAGEDAGRDRAAGGDGSLPGPSLPGS